MMASRMSDTMMAPIHCTTIYNAASFDPIFLFTSIAMVIAGLIWQPGDLPDRVDHDKDGDAKSERNPGISDLFSCNNSTSGPDKDEDKCPQKFSKIFL